MNDGSGDRSYFVKIALEGNSPFRAYVAEPEGRVDRCPSIVMAMHLWGVDAEQRETARRFAAAGFTTIVPDLYARFDAPSGDGIAEPQTFVPFATQLDSATVDSDFRAAATWLRARGPETTTAIVGFCMGGVMALRRTVEYASIFSAAAVWYGSIERAAVTASDVDIPLVASYGADDNGIPVATVAAFARELTVAYDFKVYPGAGHGFFDRHRSPYSAEAAEDSWQRTIGFLRHYLRRAG